MFRSGGLGVCASSVLSYRAAPEPSFFPPTTQSVSHSASQPVISHRKTHTMGSIVPCHGQHTKGKGSS